MIRTRLAAIAASILLAFTGTAAAHADPGTTVTTAPFVSHPAIYASNNGHNPGTLTITCDSNVLTIHTILWADAANIDQTVRVYREDTNAVVFGPVAIAAGGHLAASFPFVAGIAYDAVAVPTVDPWPAATADLIGRLSAHPPTADNSQLLPSMMPTVPTGCVAPPNPCAAHTGNELTAVATCPPCPTGEPGDKAAVVPTCIPVTTTAAHTPAPTKPSTTGSTSSSSSATTAASGQTPTAGTSSAPSGQGAPSPSGTAALVVTTTALAHTGASVAPLAAGALAAILGGGALVLYGRRLRKAGRH
jgi:hypothetical protein